MTTFRSVKIIFVIGFISISFATYSVTPHSLSDVISTAGDRFCALNITFKKTQLFYPCLSIIGFLLPMTIILIMYAFNFRVAHKRNKMILNGELGKTFNDQNQRNALCRDMKVIRMLLVVVGTFLFC